MLQTPISLSSSVFAAVCSKVLTLTLYFGCDTDAPTVRVPSFSKYGRPGSIGSVLIQMMWHSNWSATPGGSEAAAMTSPRLMSISSVSVIVTDWPATAS